MVHLSSHARAASLACRMYGRATNRPSAQDAPVPKHIEITGSQRLRLTYETSFTWPRRKSSRGDGPAPSARHGWPAYRELHLIAAWHGDDRCERPSSFSSRRSTTAAATNGACIGWCKSPARFQTRQLRDGASAPDGEASRLSPRREISWPRPNRSTGRVASFRTGSIPPACAGSRASRQSIWASAFTPT